MEMMIVRKTGRCGHFASESARISMAAVPCAFVAAASVLITRAAMPLSTTSTSSTPTVTAANVRASTGSSLGRQPPQTPPSPTTSGSRIPTPAVLRSIFASSRSVLEERSLSRVAFFRFAGFILSCLAISLAAARGRGIKSGAALLGVGVV
ncbi:hypothetical protein K474DRAFT_100059 [Panus rudis PR-1116 ss-1]|nr:hypothetical protein K474DRAFT_100059 [Panus rudis PR-1116 ss-1]